MNDPDQARRKPSLVLLLAIAVFSVGTHADDKFGYPDRDHDRAKGSGTIKTFKNQTFLSKKYNKGFKIKAWQVSDNVYMGAVKIAGEYGPGLLVDKGRYAWGFNHQSIQFQLRF